MDPEILKAYEDLTCIPEAVIKSNVYVPTTHHEATQFIQTYVGVDRVGPANTHNMDPDGLCEQALAGVNAEIPDKFAKDKPPSPPGNMSNTFILVICDDANLSCMFVCSWSR